MKNTVIILALGLAIASAAAACRPAAEATPWPADTADVGSPPAPVVPAAAVIGAAFDDHRQVVPVVVDTPAAVIPVDSPTGAIPCATLARFEPIELADYHPIPPRADARLEDMDRNYSLQADSVVEPDSRRLPRPHLE